MNKYLVKIAELSEEEKKNVKRGLGGAFVAGIAGDLGAAAATKRVMNHKDPHGFMSEHQYEAAKEHVAKHTNSTFSAHDAGLPHGMFDGSGPMYAHADAMNPHLNPPGIKMHKNFIHLDGELGKQKMVGMHEMGHAEDMHARKVKNANGLIASRKLGRGPVAGLAAAGLLSNDKTRDYAPLVPLVGHAPELFAEGAGNYHAHKLVKKFGGNTGQFKKFVGKQMLGYAAKPLIGAAMLAGAAHMIRKRDKSVK